MSDERGWCFGVPRVGGRGRVRWRKRTKDNLMIDDDFRYLMNGLHSPRPPHPFFLRPQIFSILPRPSATGSGALSGHGSGGWKAVLKRLLIVNRKHSLDQNILVDGASWSLMILLGMHPLYKTSSINNPANWKASVVLRER